jgi:membrane-associated protease RseP (regulator of RpoE activity)
MTIQRQGQTLTLTNLTVGSILVNDTSTGKVYQQAFLGVEDQSYAGLNNLVSTYTSSFLRSPFTYLCVPTLPNCASLVPFSNQLAPLYTSGGGQFTLAAANALYWLFFINFNLAIFNALPIYPLDGGQAFRAGVKALGKGRLDDSGAGRVATVASLLVVAMLLLVIAGPYLLF